MADKPFVAKNSVLIQGSNTQLTQNSLTVGNTSVNSVVNSTAAFFGNSTVNATVNSTALQLANSTAQINVSPIGIQSGTLVINTSAVAVGSFVANSSGAFVGANVQWTPAGGLIGNSTVNVSFSATAIQLANSTAQLNLSSLGITSGLVVVNATQWAVGANVIANATTMAVGNSTVYQRQTSALLTIVGAVGTANVTQNGVSVGISSVNSTAVAVGANVYANATTVSAGGSTIDGSTVFVGNSTVNTTHTSGGIQVANSTSGANVTSGGVQAGIVTVNTSAVAVGANVILTGTGAVLGNSTANATVNSTLIVLANSSGQVNVSPIDIKIGVVTVNTTTFGVGNVVANATTLYIGNSTVYQSHTGTALSISDTNSTMNLSSYGMIAGAVVVNTSVVQLGANVVLNSSGLTSGPTVVNGSVFTTGNSSVNVFANSTLLQIASGGVTANVSAQQIKIGISTVNTTVIAIGNTTMNGGSLVIGNATVNATMNSTTFTGTSYNANNATNLNGSAASAYLAFGNFTGTIGAGQFSSGTNATGAIVYAYTYHYSYGNIYAQGDIYAAYSDLRLKDNFNRINDALWKISYLDGVTYYQNKLGDELSGMKKPRRQVGLIAQDVQKVLPEAVSIAPFDMAEDGSSKSGEEYLTISYDKLVPLLVEGIKELHLKVQDLEEKLRNK